MYRLTTESGSVYQLDTHEKIMIRVPSKGEGVSTLTGDNAPMKYASLWAPPKVGEPLVIFWADGDHYPQMRVTTPLVEVVENDAS